MVRRGNETPLSAARLSVCDTDEHAARVCGRGLLAMVGKSSWARRCGSRRRTGGPCRPRAAAYCRAVATGAGAGVSDERNSSWSRARSRRARDYRNRMLAAHTVNEYRPCADEQCSDAATLASLSCYVLICFLTHSCFRHACCRLCAGGRPIRCCWWQVCRFAQPFTHLAVHDSPV